MVVWINVLWICSIIIYEKGKKEINIERTEDVKETKTEIVATGCPFCNTMLTDGAKTIEEERKISVMDISELIANAQEL